jgi:hypothetical protein
METASLELGRSIARVIISGMLLHRPSHYAAERCFAQLLAARTNNDRLPMCISGRVLALPALFMFRANAH